MKCAPGRDLWSLCLGGCRVGDNEDRSGCYLSPRAPLETWPMASSVLVSLTSACDIITHCPDINPNTVCSDKKSNAQRPFLNWSHPANTVIVGLRLCCFSGCVYEDMKYSWQHRTRPCVSTLDSTYLHSRSYGVEAWGSLAEEKQQKAERKEERGDDGGSKRGRKWG